MAERKNDKKTAGAGNDAAATDGGAPADGAGADGAGPAGPDAEAISFTDALDELNTIVAQLEAEEVDVDVMTQNVERAAFLVALCRDRLDSTRYKVEEIIVSLDPRAQPTPPQETPSEPPAE